MHRPRFSLARLMVWVALAGAEIALLRSSIVDHSHYCLVDAFALFSPMLLALGCGSYSLYRRSPASPFLFGFVAFGFVTTVVLFLGTLAEWPLTDLYSELLVRPVVETIEDALAPGARSAWDAQGANAIGYWCLIVPLELVLFALPPLMPALLAGWFSSRYEFSIAIHRRRPLVRDDSTAVEVPPD